MLLFLSFLYSVNQGIKAKYILLELKVPWPMSAISETYNRAHYVLELSKCSFLSKWNETWLILSCKYELTDELPHDVRNSMEFWYSVQSFSQNKNTASNKFLKTRYWTFLLLHCKSCLVSIWNSTLDWNGSKESIH